MRGIEELRERVLAAEERFGLNDAQRAAYGERLVVLVNGIEGCIRDQQGEIEQQAAIIQKYESEAAVRQAKIDGHDTAIAEQAKTIEKLEATGARKANENEQLRVMLQSMLQAIESDGRDGLAEAMQELDRKVNALVGGVAAETVTEESNEQNEEPPVETAIAVGPVSVGSIEEIEEVEDAAGIDAATIRESAPEEIDEPVSEADALATEDTAEEVAEETVDPIPEIEETAEPVAEPVAEPATEPAAEPAAEIEEIAEADEPVVAASAPETAPETAPDTGSAGGSLDEIMERVSKLVEETESAIAAPADSVPEDLPQDLPEEIAEDPARQATGTDP